MLFDSYPSHLFLYIFNCRTTHGVETVNTEGVSIPYEQLYVDQKGISIGLKWTIQYVIDEEEDINQVELLIKPNTAAPDDPWDNHGEIIKMAESTVLGVIYILSAFDDIAYPYVWRLRLQDFELFTEFFPNRDIVIPLSIINFADPYRNEVQRFITACEDVVESSYLSRNATGNLQVVEPPKRRERPILPTTGPLTAPTPTPRTRQAPLVLSSLSSSQPPPQPPGSPTLSSRRQVCFLKLMMISLQ